MDFTKIRGKKTAKFKEGDLVVCVFKPKVGEFAGSPGWRPQMDKTIGAVGVVNWLFESKNIHVNFNGRTWAYRPEWLIKAHDPDNILRVGEPVIYKYGKKVFVRNIKSIVGSYCELDNGSVFHWKKLWSTKRMVNHGYELYSHFWRENMIGDCDLRLTRELAMRARVFNQSLAAERSRST